MRHVRTTPKHQCPMVQIALRNSKRQIWEAKPINSVVILWHRWIMVDLHIIYHESYGNAIVILLQMYIYIYTHIYYIHTFTVYYDSDVGFTLPFHWQLSIFKTSGGFWRSIKLSTYGHQWPRWMNHLMTAITVNWKSRKPTGLRVWHTNTKSVHVILWKSPGTSNIQNTNEALLRSNIFKKTPANLELQGKNPSTMAMVQTTESNMESSLKNRPRGDREP